MQLDKNTQNKIEIIYQNFKNTINLDRVHFRIWNLETATMVYLENESLGYDLPAICENVKNGKYILMQSIGIKDKQNNLLYEGDIILFNNNKYIADNLFLCSLNNTLKKYTNMYLLGNIYENLNQHLELL